ncbi:MAG: transposase [Alcanivoracaceae bacterium]|nr:transposase [Alcanivoracaceae bacterium]
MQTSPQSNRLRKGRYSDSNRIYLITATTHHRQRWFSSFYSARLVTQQLIAAEKNGEANSLAFVIMPDHFHWLCQLQEHRNLSSVIQKMKSNVSRELRKTLRSSKLTVWQQGFHDHALRKEEDVVAISRYIIANPLRAGLVTKVGQYPHWDCVWLD